MSISIAMATYNGAGFLRAQLDSLAAQTHPPLELVVTDDASTDETARIVEDFSRTAPFPVRFHVNPERLGFRENFLKAVSLCRGELIAFSDQDDVWYPDKLATVAALFAADPETLLVHHNAVILTPDGGHPGPLVPAGRHPDCYQPLAAPPWLVSHGFTQTFRRELRQYQALWRHSADSTHSNQRMSHDHWYVFLASVFGRIRWVERPLAEYRQHASNTYGWFEESFAHRIRLWLEDRSEVYDRCRDAAQSRVTILEMLESTLERPDWRSRAATAARRYRALTELYESRFRAYQAGSLPARLRAYRALWGANAYNGRGDWTFYTKGACKDAALGVIAGPVLRRFGYRPFAGDPTCAAVVHG